MGDDVWEAYLVFAAILLLAAVAVFIAVVFLFVFDGTTLINRMLR